MADSKLTGLPENTAPLSTDQAYMVDDPAGSPVSQKVTLANLSKGLVADNIPNTPAGDIAATNIQAAIDELDSEKLGTGGGNLTGALNEFKGADIPSATTTDIGAATGNFVFITGTTTITGLGTVQAGTKRVVKFVGILTLTHNATSLILPSGANITTAADDRAEFVSLGSGNWICTNYQRADGTALVAAGGGDTVNKYFIPAPTWLTSDDEPNMTGSTLDGVGTYNGTPVVNYTNGAQELASFGFYIPTGYTTISSIRILFMSTVAADANLNLQYEFVRNRVGAAQVTDADTDTATATGGGAVNSTIAITVPPASYNGLSETTGDYISCVHTRNAVSAADTYEGNYRVLGAEVTFS